MRNKSLRARPPTVYANAMLTHLAIQDFAVVRAAELDFGPGLTVISGETGAGKSLLVDALGFLSGARADSGVVRHGAQRAELVAVFDLADASEAAAWLREQRADVVLLQEVSADWFGPLDDQLDDLYPYQVHQLTETGQRGNVTLSRFPVVLVPSVPLDSPVFQPVILDLNGQSTSFYNVALATPVDEQPRRDLPFEYPILDFAVRYDDRQRNLQIDQLLSERGQK